MFQHQGATLRVLQNKGVYAQHVDLGITLPLPKRLEF
jgi:hypothetical protein